MATKKATADTNPLHPDIASRYVDENYTQNWGIRNAQLNEMQKGVAPGRTANTPNRPRQKYQNEEVVTYGETGVADNQNFAPEAIPQPREKSSRIKNTIVVNVARIRATPVAVTISGFAIPWYFIIQLPLALLATVFITLGYGTQLLGDSSVVAEYALGSVAGFSSDMLLFLYLAFSGLLCFFYFLQIIIGTALFKIAFIHPWFGRGATFKIGSILLILISSFVPILNMFPLLGIWVAAVVMYPK
jgi:hypothetical protein